VAVPALLGIRAKKYMVPTGISLEVKILETNNEKNILYLYPTVLVLVSDTQDPNRLQPKSGFSSKENTLYKKKILKILK
jgi:hypothetical protein